MEKEPTMRDTKEVILKAYNRVAERLKQFDSVKMNPEAELKAKRVNELVESVDDVLEGKSIESQIDGLKRSLSSTLDRLASNVGDSLKVYSNIQEAIQIKEERLEELFEIETEALNLVALVNAKEELKREFDETIALRKAEADESLNLVYQKTREERLKLAKQLEEEKAEIEKSRKREQEQYEYEFNRKKQQDLDELNDAIKRKKRSYDEECEAFTKKLNEREENLNGREEEIKTREVFVDELEAKVEHLSEVISKEVEEAVKKAQSEEASKFYREKAYVEKEAKHQLEILQGKNEMLQEALDKANTTIASLTEKLEKAYAEVREIANKTIENAGDKKVINQLERLVMGGQKNQ